MIGVGDAYSKAYIFTADTIRAFAEASGDANPLHRDERRASASRFGGIIASGPHMSAVLMGALASWTTAFYESVGLDFHFRFRKALPAGTRADLSWTVVAAAHHARLKGDVLTLEGRILDEKGTVYVTCEGRCVIWPLASHEG